MRREERGRERLQARVEVVADVVLDALGAADDREAGAEPRRPVADGEDQDQQGVTANRRGRVGLERLDRLLDRPGNAEAQQGPGEQTAGSEEITRAVTGEVAPDRADCRGQRVPSANGRSAA
jgi:hypothetical protein